MTEKRKAYFYAGVNELGGIFGKGVGHAFVGLQLSDGSRLEIHGVPEGGFFPAGVRAAITDDVRLIVEDRNETVVFATTDPADKDNRLPTPHNTVRLTDGIWEDEALGILAEVRTEMKAAFLNANLEYEVPIADGCWSRCQISNMVTGETMHGLSDRLVEKGRASIKIPTEKELGAGLALPGYGGRFGDGDGRPDRMVSDDGGLFGAARDIAKSAADFIKESGKSIADWVGRDGKFGIQGTYRGNNREDQNETKPENPAPDGGSGDGGNESDSSSTLTSSPRPRLRPENPGNESDSNSTLTSSPRPRSRPENPGNDRNGDDRDESPGFNEGGPPTTGPQKAYSHSTRRGYGTTDEDRKYDPRGCSRSSLTLTATVWRLPLVVGRFLTLTVTDTLNKRPGQGRMTGFWLLT